MKMDFQELKGKHPEVLGTPASQSRLGRGSRSPPSESEGEEEEGREEGRAEEGHGGEEQVPAVRRAWRRRGQEALREPSSLGRPDQPTPSPGLCPLAVHPGGSW